MYLLPLLVFIGAWNSVLATQFLIAAFNLKVFGHTKLENQEAVDQIVKIVSRYDLVLLQEIRDRSETAIIELFNQVNEANNNAYSYVISDRLGRTTSKEQYCFFYKKEYFSVEDQYVYSDPGDVFEREPFNVRFRVADWALPDLVVSAIHTRPDDAVVELNRMVNVYEDIVKRWKIENVIIMGDFNADCDYVRKSALPQLELRSDERFQWFISDEADTTVIESTNCAYDRFVIAGEDLQNAAGDARVFNFEREYGISKEMAESVSDHYPIEMTLEVQQPSEYVTDDDGHNQGNPSKSGYLPLVVSLLGSALFTSDSFSTQYEASDPDFTLSEYDW